MSKQLPNGVYKDEQTQEWFFPERSYILSETDQYATILYANQLFCDVAGYALDELLGQPHNIVRHPDMPRIAFQGLWDDVQSKGFWSGYVKNRAKDGGFYWVYAIVLRKTGADGTVTYLSTRTKPTREAIKQYNALYADIRAKE